MAKYGGNEHFLSLQKRVTSERLTALLLHDRQMVGFSGCGRVEHGRIVGWDAFSEHVGGAEVAA